MLPPAAEGLHMETIAHFAHFCLRKSQAIVQLFVKRLVFQPNSISDSH